MGYEMHDKTVGWRKTIPHERDRTQSRWLVAVVGSLLVGLTGWTMLLAPLFEALLWPVFSWLLLAPQRRAPDRDENRPL